MYLYYCTFSFLFDIIYSERCQSIFCMVSQVLQYIDGLFSCLNGLVVLSCFFKFIPSIVYTWHWSLKMVQANYIITFNGSDITYKLTWIDHYLIRDGLLLHPQGATAVYFLRYWGQHLRYIYICKLLLIFLCDIYLSLVYSLCDIYLSLIVYLLWYIYLLSFIFYVIYLSLIVDLMCWNILVSSLSFVTHLSLNHSIHILLNTMGC